MTYSTADGGADNGQFLGLLERVRAGSQEAIRQLVREHEHQVRVAVRRRLNRIMRSKFDSEDFAQSVWKSFFCGTSGRVPSFKTPAALIAFLSRMAERKVTDEWRRRCRNDKRDLARERPLDSAAIQLTDRRGTPSKAAMANECVAILVEGQPEHYRRIVELRAAGATFDEIGVEVGLDRGSVRRILLNLIMRIA